MHYDILCVKYLLIFGVCTDSFEGSDRHGIFSSFWRTGSKQSPTAFVISMVEEDEPASQRCKASKQHNVVRPYHLQKNGTRHRVCKLFFLSTLDISATTVTTALRNSELGFPGQECPDRHISSTKVSQPDLDFVLKHISTFPKMKPHYNRHDSTHDYLPYNLNIRIMHGLYLEFCTEHGRVPVKEPIYRGVFHEDCNLSFHKPKKDSCLLCDKYENKLITYDEYNSHIKRRKLIRKEPKLIPHSTPAPMTWTKYCHHQAHPREQYFTSKSCMYTTSPFIPLVQAAARFLVE